MNLLEHHNLIKDINKLVNNLLEVTYSPVQKAEIKNMKRNVGSLRTRMAIYKATRNPYKKIEISWKGKTDLAMKGLTKKRSWNLVGDMFFQVVDLKENDKYIDIRTQSFPKELLIRLEYTELKEGKPQFGKVWLVYDRPGSKREQEAGDEKRIGFTIRKLIKR